MNEIGRLPCAWGRYDDVAERFERFQASNGYAALAADLVAALNLTPGGSLLDVGCGTGAATVAAQKAVGARGLVVGLDLSLAMLRRAAAANVAHLVVGIVPGLPFRDRRFDGVAASLVLSHVERYAAALRDMVRVLKPGGRVAVSAAAKSPHRPNVASRAWEATAESFVGREALREAPTRVVPWEAWLTAPAHIETALANVGLEGIAVVQRDYRVTMPAEDYLSMLDLFAYGRFVRQHIGSGRWPAFRERVAAKVAAHGLKQVEYTSRYHVGVGTRRR
jgi:ubiquinone/menaquinone biosynthesis C-methylase UbiE